MSIYYLVDVITVMYRIPSSFPRDSPPSFPVSHLLTPCTHLCPSLALAGCSPGAPALSRDGRVGGGPGPTVALGPVDLPRRGAASPRQHGGADLRPVPCAPDKRASVAASPRSRRRVTPPQLFCPGLDLTRSPVWHPRGLGHISSVLSSISWSPYMAAPQ